MADKKKFDESVVYYTHKSKAFQYWDGKSQQDSDVVSSAYVKQVHGDKGSWYKIDVVLKNGKTHTCNLSVPKPRTTE